MENLEKYETIKSVYVAYYDCYGYLNYEEIDLEKEHDGYPEFNDELLPVEPCEYRFYDLHTGGEALEVTFYATYERTFYTDKHGDSHIDDLKKVVTSEPTRDQIKHKLLYGGK